MFYPASARKVFPCFDEPRYKSQFKLILQHDKDVKAVSNMDYESIVCRLIRLFLYIIFNATFMRGSRGPLILRAL